MSLTHAFLVMGNGGVQVVPSVRGSEGLERERLLSKEIELDCFATGRI